MTAQKFEALGVRELRRKEVVDTIYIGTQDVLKIYSAIDDVAHRAACVLHGEQISDGEVSQDLDEQFGREVEEGSIRLIGRCNVTDLSCRCLFVFAIRLFRGHGHTPATVRGSTSVTKESESATYRSEPVVVASCGPAREPT